MVDVQCYCENDKTSGEVRGCLGIRREVMKTGILCWFGHGERMEENDLH